MTKAQACAAHGGAPLSEVFTRPLCRRYVLGLFDIAVVRWPGATGVQAHPVHWAFGWLADGECEPLGVWTEPGGESASPLRSLAHLKARGLERIRHVTGTDVGRLRERAAAAFSQPAFGRMAAPGGAASWPEGTESPELAAGDVRVRLTRAIRRRGSFASEAAALDFISGALQRTERRLDRERAIAKVRPRQASGAQMVPPGF